MPKCNTICLSLLIVLLINQGASANNNTQSKNNSGQTVFSTPDPHSALEHNNRGVEMGSRGLWKEAVEEHQFALLEKPTNKYFRTNLSSAHFHYGLSLINLGNTSAAIDQLHRALYVDPNNKEAEEKLSTLESENSLGFEAHRQLFRVETKRTLPTQEGLDRFLKGNGKTLPGYDSVGY